jgi:S1-C subfamily serine protease
MEVVFVPPHTPGAEAGFLAGDIILAVNDIGVEHLNGLTALSDLMRAEAGTEYKFTIIRGGTKKSLKLKLANLFD